MKKWYDIFPYTVAILSVISVFIFIIAIIFYFIGDRGKYSTGRDTVKSFGDARFQILDGNTKFSLFDEKLSNSPIIYDIEKYIEKDPYVYFVGYYANEGFDDHCKFSPCIGINPKTGEKMEYKTWEDVPRYTILNPETGEVRLYKKIDEVSEADRKMFEQKCVRRWFWPNCWEKGVKWGPF